VQRFLDEPAGIDDDVTEFSARVAGAQPDWQVLGVELLESSVQFARDKHAALAPRLAAPRDLVTELRAIWSIHGFGTGSR